MHYTGTIWCHSTGSFARITDISLKTNGEFSELHRLGYDGITIGVDSALTSAENFNKQTQKLLVFPC